MLFVVICQKSHNDVYCCFTAYNQAMQQGLDGAMTIMHNHPHPGELVKATLIDGADLTVTAAAQRLGINRVSLSKLVNCHCGISPEMAMRLSIALNSSTEMWLNLQKNYDLWCVEKSRNKIAREVSRIKTTRIK